MRKTHVYKEATDRWGYSVAKRKDPLGNPYKTGDSKTIDGRDHVREGIVART